MARTGPQKYPGASTAYWFGNRYTGAAMEINVCVWHTTEGTSVPTYGGGASAPTITALPDFKNKRLVWYQHFDIDQSARALVDRAGGITTNRNNAAQVELVGTCDPPTHKKWKAAGRAHIFWPEAPDWALREVAEFVRWLNDEHNVPMRSTVTWRPYPSSYGQNASQRLSSAAFNAYTGHLGHQHVPEGNDHGDPGSIDFARIIALAKDDDEPAPPSTEEDTDMTPAQEALLKQLTASVARLEREQAVAPWTYRNPTQDAASRKAGKRIPDMHGRVQQLQTTLDALTKAVAELTKGA